MKNSMFPWFPTLSPTGNPQKKPENRTSANLKIKHLFKLVSNIGLSYSRTFKIMHLFLNRMTFFFDGPQRLNIFTLITGHTFHEVTSLHTMHEQES